MHADKTADEIHDHQPHFEALGCLLEEVKQFLCEALGVVDEVKGREIEDLGFATLLIFLVLLAERVIKDTLALFGLLEMVSAVKDLAV